MELRKENVFLRVTCWQRSNQHKAAAALLRASTVSAELIKPVTFHSHKHAIPALQHFTAPSPHPNSYFYIHSPRACAPVCFEPLSHWNRSFFIGPHILFPLHQ
ncbi:hypothetical protein M405DRAFT_869848 [Rhizopogon salebrosus TDB-379]|nr:hypothetical protein M405DRAFT_869848 [Rhizopogon salebrosus TDB-379]